MENDYMVVFPSVSAMLPCACRLKRWKMCSSQQSEKRKRKTEQTERQNREPHSLTSKEEEMVKLNRGRTPTTEREGRHGCSFFVPFQGFIRSRAPVDPKGHGFEDLKVLSPLPHSTCIHSSSFKSSIQRRFRQTKSFRTLGTNRDILIPT